MAAICTGYVFLLDDSLFYLHTILKFKIIMFYILFFIIRFFFNNFFSKLNLSFFLKYM